MAESIDELTSPPVVGRRYLVPTVRYPWFGKVADWPVMGPRHEDAEHLKFPQHHYHVDIRFLTKAQIGGLDDAVYPPEVIVAAAPLATRGEAIHPPPVWRLKKCQRADHGYPVATVRAAPRADLFAALQATYAGRPCAANAAGLLVCPHKGFALGSLAPDDRGRVVCPLHGLVIDVRAGVVAQPDGPPHA